MKKKYFTTYEIEDPEKPESKPSTNKKEESATLSFLKDKFLDLNIDDMLILVLIFILLTEDEPDMMTIMALGYIFLV